MDETTVFDRLVKSLSGEERKHLLERITQTVTLPTEPLTREKPEGESLDVERELEKLSLLQRFFLFLKTLFTKKDRFTLVKEMLLKRLEAEIQSQYGGLMDFQSSFFLEKMRGELAGLKDSLLFLEKALSEGLGKEKRDFIAFLAKSELEVDHARLETETDPYALWNSSRMAQEEDVRAEMLERFNAIIEEIPEEDRRRIYLDIQALHTLHALCAQPFASMLGCFRPQKAGGWACEFPKLGRYLQALADHLAAAEFAPSAQAVRALFIFSHRSQLENEEFDLEEQLAVDFEAAKQALAGIRGFNARVPLIPVVRYINEDLGYRPRELGGGEDWFVLFKDFWKKRLEASYREFLNHRKRLRLTEEALKLLGRAKLPEVSGFAEENSRHTLSLSFLRAFTESLFKRLYKPLRMVIMNGRFYKEENRQDFTAACDCLNRIEERIAQLETKQAPGGEFEFLKSGERSTKQEAAQRASREALALIEECGGRVHKLTLVLDGILHGKPGAPFDTLSNLTTLGGQENKPLLAALNRALEQLEESRSLLAAMRDLEA